VKAPWPVSNRVARECSRSLLTPLVRHLVFLNRSSEGLGGTRAAQRRWSARLRGRMEPRHLPIRRRGREPDSERRHIPTLPTAEILRFPRASASPQQADHSACQTNCLKGAISGNGELDRLLRLRPRVQYKIKTALQRNPFDHGSLCETYLQVRRG
jgi:hypothetical protein